ncbi:MAG: putative RND superfamily exporter protein [Luteibaculaceae bacterium]|jgi:predicted RND superfamily exporter protein
MIRKTIASILSVLVLVFTVIAVLAVWDVIEIEHLFKKSIATIFVLFIGAAIVLFIYSMVYKGSEDEAPAAEKFDI